MSLLEASLDRRALPSKASSASILFGGDFCKISESLLDNASGPAIFMSLELFLM